MEYGKLTGAIISAAIAVHQELGPGLLERIYETCLVRELELRGFRVKRQVRIPVKYKGEPIDEYYVIDLLVEGRVIVEVKATETNHPVHKAQVITYLKIAGLEEGLVLNFGCETLIQGVQRAVRTL